MTTKITLNNIADTALATLTGPKVTTIVYPGTETATDVAGGETINLTGAGFQTGCSVLVASTASSVVTFISSTQVSFIAPALSAGTYVIYVINPDGGTAISIPGISYSGTPNWTTTAGSLGTAYETGAISSTLTATGDAPITYTLASGTLPTGSSLASNGTLSGTAQATASATTYTFTVTAKDAQNQTTNRSFNLTINPDVVTWGSPADNTTYTVTKDTQISNVTLSATSAAGGSITYTADTLPTGLSITGANIAGTPTVSANTTTVLTATSTATRTATKTINWVVNVGNDPYFKYTTLLLQGASTTFVDDASTNNFAVTIAGDTKPNRLNPYTPGYYSNYFDGAGDWITIANNAALAFGTGEFTVECWVCITQSTGTSGTVANYSNGQSTNTNFSWELYYNGGTEMWFSVFDGATQYIAKSTALRTNSWNHIAAVRSGNTLTIYVNGVAGATTVSIAGVTIANLASATLKLCSYGNGSTYITGYISNFRIVKGTAVYTTTFTPSTTPLTAITNTSLLICQSNRFIDNSTNAFTITVTGDTKIQSFNPFTPNSSYSTYGSGYFDGTGDYLVIADNVALQLTADFTIEFYIYATALSGRIIVKGNNASNDYSIDLNANGTFTLNNSNGVATSTGSITVNSWNHFALTRSGSSCTWWINGASSGTFTYSNSLNNTNAFWIGQNQASGLNFSGYLTDVRVVKGTAVYTTAFTPPSAPLTAIANTSLLTLQNNQSVNNSVFLDNSSNNFLVTRYGNATQGTFSPYGGNWSTYIPSAGQTYITAGTSTNLALGAGNFTFESWLYLNSLAPSYTTLFDWRTNGSAGSGIPVITDFNNNGTLAFVVGNGSGFTQVVTSSSAIPLNSWFHLAVVRNSTTVTMYFNGTSVGSGTSSASIGIESFNIGNPQVANYTAPMYVSNVRLVKGTAVYTGNFTPPTTPLTPIANTQLLTCQSSMWLDNSLNRFSVSNVSTISIQRFSPFNPSSVTPTSYSGYFGTANGNGLYLSDTTNGIALSGNFTIETWLYPTGASGSGYSVITTANASAGIFQYYYNSAGKIGYYTVSAGAVLTSSAALTFNTWQHVALVRSSNVVKVYVNGVEQTWASAITDSTTVYANYISGIGSTYNIFGYASNFRVTTTAVYTTAFTAPTSPLTAITGTQLLTLQSSTFIDNSTNNYTIYAVGSPTPSIQNPFGYTSATTQGYSVSTIGGSAYFDGTGDYLTAPASTGYSFGSGTFTVEAWVYKTTAAVQGIASIQNASNGWTLRVNANNTVQMFYPASSSVTTTGTVTLNTWTHIAAVRVANTVTIYLNGVNAGSSTFGAEIDANAVLGIGLERDGTNAFLGYISDVRVVKGTALYTSNFVPPSAPLTPIQNSSLLLNMTSAGIYDAATTTNMETVGDAKLSTAITKFGGTSMAFDGTGDYVSMPNSPNLSITTGDYTVEGWFYTTDNTQIQTIVWLNGNTASYAALRFGISGSGGVQMYIGDNGTGPWYANSGNIGTVANNTWYHFAVSKSSTNVRVFLNGTQIGTTYTAPAAAFAGTLNYIGALNYNDQGSPVYRTMYGYIDDLRITKGYARYTSNFTAPTSEHKTY